MISSLPNNWLDNEVLNWIMNSMRYADSGVKIILKTHFLAERKVVSNH